MDLRFTELMQSTKLMVEDLAMVKAGDEVLVVTDTRIGEYYGAGELFTALIASICAAGAEPIILTITPRERANGELPKLVRDAMKSKTDTVIFTALSYESLHTLANIEARKNGARIMPLPGGSMGKLDDMIYRLLPKTKAEVDGISGLTKRAGERFRNGHDVRVTTEKGTDITMKIGELASSAQDGYCTTPGKTQFVPTGDICVGVNPGTANGRVVIDGSASPVGGPLKEPIYMTFKDGLLVDIQGGAEAQRYKELSKAEAESESDPKVYSLAEIGCGTNPGAQIMGEGLEDERYYGGGHIGVGDNASFGGDNKSEWHADCVFLNATIEIDGELILKDGEFLI